MYTITCCRIGKYPYLNIKARGQFKKTFKNLKELAIYSYNTRKCIYFPNINNELTDAEFQSINQKIQQYHTLM